MNLTSHFRTLRVIFIAGYVGSIIVYFIPVEVMNNPNIPPGSYSMFDIIKMIAQVNPPVAMVMVFFFALNIVIVVLALTYPKRWVFIVGASYAALALMYSFVSSSGQMVEFSLIMAVISWAIVLAELTGFFIKPASAVVPAPAHG
jgi:hypothetical protein